MNFYVAVTDNRWFEYLSEIKPDEVNFWKPGGGRFSAIQAGELFLFKLHSPLNFITGGGFFLRYSQLPLSLAWEAFGEKNGASDFETFRDAILSYRNQQEDFGINPMIGCIILTRPFFFKVNEWIPSPKDWAPSIVQGKTYSTDTSIGREIWDKVMERINGRHIIEEVGEDGPLYGNEYLVKARLGQGSFRVLVTDTYKRQCAITQEKTLPVLEAAHIKPVSKSGPYKIKNGLLLRSDLHKLFDLGYMTVTQDYKVEVSKKIREEYENGRDYYKLHGSSINLPSDRSYYPSIEYIQWHNENIFKG
ncbi:MAG: HNH endonuclease [Candidatus Schekmanbacteria bacterium]|nr:MAG: HNH endonuclease [Candidatus Schekmanbacteria bacterium]